MKFKNLNVFAMQLPLVKAGVIALLGAFSLSPAAAWAKGEHTPRFRHMTAPVNLLAPGNWVTQGGVSVASDGTVTLTENGSESEQAYKDVAVSGRAGEHVVFVAYTKAETVRANDITGLPVIHGYAMGADGKIMSRFKGQATIRKDAKSGEWTVSSGVFKVPAGTVKIRYFLDQAEKAGSSKNGDDAMFTMAGLYVVKDKQAAERIVGNYHFGLQLLK